tara:strand:+ start:4953 stop:5177 length:225 start_codon:yes stop_codon:yes gene_type:complete
MFEIGSLILIRRSDVDEPVAGIPPGLIIRRYSGYPLDLQARKAPRTVYDVFMGGRVETAVDDDWIMLLNDPNTL